MASTARAGANVLEYSDTLYYVYYFTIDLFGEINNFKNTAPASRFLENFNKEKNS
jgi:hypothetical protein